MPTFESVPLEEAQRRPASSRRARMMEEYQGYIASLGAGKAAKVTPTEGETAQAVRRRLGAAAKASGVNLRFRRGGDSVYFWKVSRRGRPRRSPQG